MNRLMVQVNNMSGKKTVIYKGNQYDITNFIDRHPGGSQVIDYYLANTLNITEVFKSIHSSAAERRLLTLPQVAKAEKTKSQKTYLKIEERVSKLYQLSNPLQILLIAISLTLYAVSIFVSHPLVVIFFYASSQILTAWICHSQLHSHNKRLKQAAKVIGGVVMGLSAHWWSKKHTAHHLFTNSQNLDQDIDHNYRTILYPLLLIKWRISSLCNIVKHMQFVEGIWISLGYYWLLKQKLAFMVVGTLIASFYIAVIALGNHQRQIKYRRGYLDSFFEHQIASTTDYDFPLAIMLVLFGGFQYHTEHHLFPQVPFYRLEQAKKIILEELPTEARQIKVSSLF